MRQIQKLFFNRLAQTAKLLSDIGSGYALTHSLDDDGFLHLGVSFGLGFALPSGRLSPRLATYCAAGAAGGSAPAPSVFSEPKKEPKTVL